MNDRAEDRDAVVPGALVALAGREAERRAVAGSEEGADAAGPAVADSAAPAVVG